MIFIDDEYRRPYVQFFFHNQPHRSNKTATTIDGTQPIHRCDLHDRALRLTRDIQRAKEIFEEDKLTYIPPVDEEEEDDDDISGEQQTDETVQMT